MYDMVNKSVTSIGQEFSARVVYKVGACPSHTGQRGEGQILLGAMCSPLQEKHYDMLMGINVSVAQLMQDVTSQLEEHGTRISQAYSILRFVLSFTFLLVFIS